MSCTGADEPLAEPAETLGALDVSPRDATTSSASVPDVRPNDSAVPHEVDKPTPATGLPSDDQHTGDPSDDLLDAEQESRPPDQQEPSDPASEMRLPNCGIDESTVAPAAPFAGIVRVSGHVDPVCENEGRNRVRVQIHDSRTRATTVLEFGNLKLGQCAQLATVSNRGIEFVAYGNRLGSSGGWWTGNHRVVIPWGASAQVERLPKPSGPSQDSHPSSTSASAWRDELQAGLSTISLAVHANGVALSVGDATAGYALSDFGIPDPPQQSALMGDFRRWGRSAMLDGTDGELVAFSVWQDSDPCGSRETFVLSMRTGEAIACGVPRQEALFFVAPREMYLTADPVRLPSSRWLDRSDCAHGLGNDLFEYLDELSPLPDPPGSTLVPVSDLPDASAPARPFGGVVRSSLQYDPRRYRHDLVVEFFDPASRSTSEIVFVPRMIAGFDPGLSVVPDGLVVARRTGMGDRIVIPWGDVPQEVNIGHPGSEQWATDDPAVARQPASLPLLGEAVEIAGYEPWPVGVLTLSRGAETTTLVLSAPPDEVPGAVDDRLGERSPSWTTSLRGTDGNVVAFTYLHSYFDDCLSLCGLELTYLISVEAGDVLTCGVEPRYSEFEFVAPADAAPLSSSAVLPPSGWLDPAPCLRGLLADGFGCSILVHESEPDTRCVREFDLGSAVEGIAGAEVTPALRGSS